ncbi:hypothetical protein COU76_00935 [Candidatus Peregrinibacteria bacterium CG10_big_fil_rev_8_21_14_0_10_49_10]|nr:MAG: hypothetical protein COU76_00935 [Candidatus Peregrinibacteria bacterium CG10_big_fil_rev_8_21_14_0_10_49_10]
MPALYSITVALIVAVLGGELARKFHYPRVIGQLVISLLCSAPFLRAQFSEPASLDMIETLSYLGVILLLFLTGFDLDLARMKTVGKDAVSIAIMAAILPFLLGFGLARYLGMGMQTAIILGACLSLTAEGTKVALLLELGKVKSRVGSTMLGAGIIDDVFEILFLATVLVFAHKGSTYDLYLFPVKILAFVAVILLFSRILPSIVQRLEKAKDMTGLLTIMSVIALLFALGSELAGLGSILGAFIGGILLQRSFLTSQGKDGEDHMLQALAFSLIVPFFFVNIGLNFSFEALRSAPLLTVLVLVTALIGKIGGTLLTKPVSSLSWRQLYLVGWGMNSRGVMELVIAQIALTAGLIDRQLYSAIVFMAIVTTVLFPLVMQHMLKRTQEMMD